MRASYPTGFVHVRNVAFHERAAPPRGRPCNAANCPSVAIWRHGDRERALNSVACAVRLRADHGEAQEDLWEAQEALERNELDKRMHGKRV